MGAVEFTFQDFAADDRLLKRQKENDFAQKIETRFREGYDQGYNKGLAEGLEQGRTEILQSLEQVTTTVLESLGQKMTDMILTIEAFYVDAEQAHQNMIKNVFEKCVPALYNVPLAEQVAGLLKTHRSILETHAVITIEVHADVLESVKTHIEKVSSIDALKQKLHFEAASDLEKNDLRLRWNHGGMEKLSAAFMQNLDEIIGRHESTEKQKDSQAKEDEA